MELERLTINNVESGETKLDYEKKIQELYEYLENSSIDIPMVKNFVKENGTILHKSFKKYRDKNIVQIACSNLAGNISSKQNIAVLDELVSGDNLFYSNRAENCKEVIHYAALSSKPDILRSIIRLIQANQANDHRISATNSDGETALSLLLKKKNPSKNIECIKILLESGIDVNISDINNATPILLAFKKYENYLQQKIETLQPVTREIIELLINVAKCDVDSHRLNNKTARMYFSMYREKLDGVSLEPERRKKADETSKAAEVFGLLKEGREASFFQHPELEQFVNHSDGTMTLLQLACRKGYEKSVRFLLKMQANVDVRTEKNDYPLEICGKEGFVEIFAAVLAKSKHIPPHLVMEIAENLHRFSDDKVDHEKCLKLLLRDKRSHCSVNSVNVDKSTALHCATKLRKPKSALRLLKAGARLSAKDKDGNMPIDDIDLGTLERYFNYRIHYKNKRIYNNPWVTEEDKKAEKEIRINYVDLLPAGKSCTSHTEVIKKISETSDLKPILKHPLISSFLYLKWHQIRWLHYFNLIIFAIYCCLLYVYIFLYYLSEPTSIAMAVSLGFITLCLVLREIMQCVSRPNHYFSNFENYMEIILFVITFFIIFQFPTDMGARKQLAALVILLSAHELVLSLGQLPRYSTNVQMLKTVTWNFITFIVWYSTLLLGFALSFYILFRKKETTKDDAADNGELDLFQNLSLSVVKAIVMLTGEFDASSIKFQLYPFTSILIFLTFVFMISMVVFNLLNGLAITDIQEIMQQAEIVANKSRLRYILMLESLFEKFYEPEPGKKKCRVKFLREYFYQKIYANSEFFRQGAVIVSKEGRVLRQDGVIRPVRKLFCFKSGTYLEQATFDQVKNIVEIANVETTYSQDQQIIENQKKLEVTHEKILREQKCILGQLSKLEQDAQLLHTLLKKNLNKRRVVLMRRRRRKFTKI